MCTSKNEKASTTTLQWAGLPGRARAAPRPRHDGRAPRRGYTRKRSERSIRVRAHSSPRRAGGYAGRAGRDMGGRTRAPILRAAGSCTWGSGGRPPPGGRGVEAPFSGMLNCFRVGQKKMWSTARTTLRECRMDGSKQGSAVLGEADLVAFRIPYNIQETGRGSIHTGMVQVYRMVQRLRLWHRSGMRVQVGGQRAGNGARPADN